MTYSATVRTALRDAMLEEMQIDKNVFLIGEEVANYNGAYNWQLICCPLKSY